MSFAALTERHLSRVGKTTLSLMLLVLAGCEGAIDARAPGAGPLSPIDTTPGAPKLELRCQKPGQGTTAKMRLLWRGAYLGELTTHLGEGAATVAQGVGLSPASGRSFAFESAGSLVTDPSLDSLATTADAVAVWALSTDANAQAVFGCNARTATGAAAETCFTAFVQGKGQRLLRRGIGTDESAQLLAFFKSQVLEGESDGAQEGFRQGLASLLVHPDFLYVRDVPMGQSTSLEPFSIANRVSFALTGHGPDEQLFNAARDGSLARREVLQSEVERLLQTPDAHARSLAFYRQWLGYDRGSIAYSPAFLNGLDTTGLQAAATAELDTFVGDLTWGNKTPADLLTSKKTAALPASLSKIYDAAEGATELPNARAGLLTRVGMVASGSDDWHIVARGLGVVQKFMCKKIAPPNINTADAAKQAEGLKASNLERIKSITSSAACAGCHTTINPVGGARSDFDAIGRSVTIEKHFAGGVFDFEVPVVASADLTVPFARAASATGSVELSALLASAPEYDTCFAEQYTQHLLGREDVSNGCIEDDAAKTIFNGGTILQAMTAAVTSPEFVLWKD